VQRRLGVMDGLFGRDAAGDPGLIQKDNVLHVLPGLTVGMDRGEHYLSRPPELELA